jgi:WD40 repeat protein
MVIQAGILCKWTNDSQRFLLEHIDTIHDSPSHIYHSSLPFSPSSSWLHKCYGAELLQEVRVVKGLPAEWGKCSHTVFLDSDTDGLSYWNNTIAVGSKHGIITILDVVTGSQITVLSGHTDRVDALTFSLDGRSLVSGSYDKTVKLWDMQTGGTVKTFTGPTESVASVSISPDFVTIAAGSHNRSIYLWDSQTGECHCVIGQPYYARYISFSPTDPQHFLSICDSKVQQWDINGHQVKPTFDGSRIAFSSDGTQFAVCYRGAVTVQNYNSRAIVAQFHVANDTIKYCCFSPDDKLIATSAGVNIDIWNIASTEPYLIETFVEPTKIAISLAFCPPSSLISLSIDQSVKFWQIGTLSTDPVITHPKSTSIASAVTRSITLRAKDGITITSDYDGVVKTWDILTGLCKASFQTPAKGICRRDVQLINGRLVLAWYAKEDEKINIWNAEKGELLLAVDGVSAWWPHDLKVSGDRSRIFLLDDNSIRAWSVQTGEFMGKVEVKINALYGSLNVDGSRVWTHSTTLGYQGWDFGTPGPLPIQSLSIFPGRLHPNGAVLWDTGMSQIKDKVTGEVIFHLPKRYGKPDDVQWNDQYLVACFMSTEVLVLDFSHLLLK